MLHRFPDGADRSAATGAQVPAFQAGSLPSAYLWRGLASVSFLLTGDQPILIRSPGVLVVPALAGRRLAGRLIERDRGLVEAPVVRPSGERGQASKPEVEMQLRCRDADAVLEAGRRSRILQNIRRTHSHTNRTVHEVRVASSSNDAPNWSEIRRIGSSSWGG